MELEQKLINELTENSIFEGLSPEQIDHILPCIVNTIRTYGSRECVLDKGERVEDLGVVLDGELMVCDEGVGGTNTGSIEKNQLVGDMSLFSSDSSLPHRVIALDGAKVLFLSGDFFLQQCGKNCDMREAHQIVVKNMMRLLSDKAMMLNKKIAYLTAPDLKTKIAMYLCELYELNGVTTFNMPLNRDRLAEFFAVARPSLSRELINMKNLGLIDFYRSTVKILDLDGMYQIARCE